MSIVFDPFTGQIIDTGASTGMAIGGPVAGADPNSVLIVDGALTLQNIPLTSGQIVTSQGGVLVSSSITGNSASQISVDALTFPNEIRLSLPQDIALTDSPQFTGLTLSSLSGPVKAGLGGLLSSSAIDLASSEVTNILTVDKGGTGLDGSAAPNGHILIGNGSGYTLAEILGTSNQVDVANGSGSIQLSLPQDIDSTASPEFTGLTLSSLSGPVKAGAGGVLTSSAIDLATEVTGILPIANGGTNTNTTPTNGQLLIGNGTSYSVANITSSTLTSNPDRIIISNGAGTIDLDLPQNINTTSSPQFANLSITSTGVIDNPSDSGPTDTLNIGTGFADIINIGRVGATVNVYGDTFYQEVTNLEVKDKNITINKNGAPASAGGAGLDIEEDALITAYAKVSTDRNSWELKAPNQTGVITLQTNSTNFTINHGISSTQDVSLDTPDTVYLNANALGSIDASAHKIENVADPVSAQDAMTLNYADNQYLPIATFDEYNTVQKEPTGFANASATSISFNDATREFTIAPTSGSYDFYVKGVKFTKSSPITITISADMGNHYIYFDINGDLISSLVFSPSVITDNAFVSIVYWNPNTNSHVYFANERHGLVMDGMTHSYLHTTFGARFLSGGALQNFAVDGTGNDASDAQFTSDSGSIRDEDLLIQYLAQTEIPILYRINTEWRKKAADAYPVIYSGTAGYTGANGRLAYNLLSGGNWSLTEVDNNKYVLVHVFATNDINNPVVGIQGINQYESISSARTGAANEIGTISGLPFAEFVALGSVIFETSNSYTNIPKARIRSTDTGADYVDFRGTQTYAPAGGTVSSHSLLSNLSSDDHLQYFNESRGDILGFANGGLGFNTYPGANYLIGFNNANNAIENKNLIAGTGIGITHGVGSITIANTSSSSSDINPSSWSGLINNTLNQEITGLLFSSTVSSFIAYIDILIDATADLYSYVEVRGKRKSPSDWSINDIQCSFIGDEIAGLNFEITSAGQVTIDIGNISGFVSGELNFRALALV